MRLQNQVKATLNNFGAICVEMGVSVFEKKSSFKIMGQSFSSKLDRSSYIVSITKTASKKTGALIRYEVSLSRSCSLSL